MAEAYHNVVHCRTGSLESHTLRDQQRWPVHCRTGSLESNKMLEAAEAFVHCRTGSLETDAKAALNDRSRALPYRQLRNIGR